MHGQQIRKGYAYTVITNANIQQRAPESALVKVNGITAFRNYFGAYADNYIIIGGIACDMVIDAAGLTPRATRDIDIILIVEALTPAFIVQFWNFVKEASYKKAEKNNEDRKYYRFRDPENNDFPFQVELFSRTPDLLDDLAQRKRTCTEPMQMH